MRWKFCEAFYSPKKKLWSFLSNQTRMQLGDIWGPSSICYCSKIVNPDHHRAWELLIFSSTLFFTGKVLMWEDTLRGHSWIAMNGHLDTQFVLELTMSTTKMAWRDTQKDLLIGLKNFSVDLVWLLSDCFKCPQMCLLLLCVSG